MKNSEIQNLSKRANGDLGWSPQPPEANVGLGRSPQPPEAGAKPPAAGGKGSGR